MLRTTRIFGAAALGLLLATAACHDDVLFRAVSNSPIDPLFARYVSVGNSITAGFQSGGINETTQLQSYAVLLARQMQTPFFAPLMSAPGCPALFTNVFTNTRASTIPCALRKRQTPPPPWINNVAVPGAEVMDAIANLDTASNANQLTAFFLGGYTQAEMMEKVRPTFVTVWLGNNDVLGAATNAANAGDSTRITPVTTYQTRKELVYDEIESLSPLGAVVVGVANVTGIPFFSRGSTYFALKAAGQLPPLLTVAATCAPPPGDNVLVPFPFGGALIAAASPPSNQPQTLDCTEPQTVQPAELTKLVNTVLAYNAYDSTQAAARGWVWFNPNPTLDSLRLVGGTTPPVRPFPLFGQACSANPFGTAFSCDAVHPSAATHRLLANKVIRAINTKYTTALQLLP